MQLNKTTAMRGHPTNSFFAEAKKIQPRKMHNHNYNIFAFTTLS